MFSCYVTTIRTTNAFFIRRNSAYNAARTIIDWAAAFGVPKSQMSDGTMHFKNEIIRLVEKILNLSHHFTLPNCPWSNGSVERLGKELLHIFRAAVSELQIRIYEWTDLFPLYESAPNNAPLPQGRNVSPVTYFTCLDHATSISVFMQSTNATTITINDIQRELVLKIDKLFELVAELNLIVRTTLL